jgi:hypothetical protein
MPITTQSLGGISLLGFFYQLNYLGIIGPLHVIITLIQFIFFSFIPFPFISTLTADRRVVALLNVNELYVGEWLKW